MAPRPRMSRNADQREASTLGTMAALTPVPLVPRGPRHRVAAYRRPGTSQGAQRHDRARKALLIDRHSALMGALCATSTARRSPDYSGVVQALDQVRRSGCPVVVASHNRAPDPEALDVAEFAAMSERIEAALGAIDLWCVCLVDPDGSCACDGDEGGPLGAGARSLGLEPSGMAVATADPRLAGAAERLGAENLFPIRRSTGSARPRHVALEAAKLSAGAASLAARAREAEQGDGTRQPD